MFKEYLKIAIKNLRTRSLRSWLTIIGIIIGVFLIIALISLSEGLKAAVMKELNMMGNNMVFVFPGETKNMMSSFAGGMTLTNKDMEAIEKTEGVEAVLPFVYKGEIARNEGKSETVFLSGIDFTDHIPLLESDMGWSLKEGSWPERGKDEIAIGNVVAKDIFPGISVGSEVTIKGRKFIVSGIMKSLGNRQDDSMMIIEYDTFIQLTGERDKIRSAVAKVANGYSTDEVAELVKRRLEETRKRIGYDDQSSVSVLTSEKLTDLVGNIMGLIQGVIVGFASIAIVVGGIGIMNTMYTSVKERTREIGVLKAIGARNSMVSSIFLMEAGVIGLIGGVGGVIFGIGFAKLVEIILSKGMGIGMTAVTSPFLVLFGLAFSFLIGCGSGFLPARQASLLKPVDALRYE